MTDSEIITALENCAHSTVQGKCKECPAFKMCGEDIYAIEKEALNLINRQKAEIEQLQKRIVFWREDMDYRPDEIKSEAIKEFAERLKPSNTERYISYAKVERLVKEMTEGKENA